MRDSFYILASASPRQPQSFRTGSLCHQVPSCFSWWDFKQNNFSKFQVLYSLLNCSLAKSGTYKSRSATERTKYQQPVSCDRFQKVLRWFFRLNSDWSSAVWRQLPTGVSQTKPPEMTLALQKTHCRCMATCPIKKERKKEMTHLAGMYLRYICDN